MTDRNHFGILLVSGAVALSAIAVAVGTTYLSPKSEYGAVAVSNTPNAGFDAAKDSDGDGVPDWKESLLGTDPNNPDTNGDGVPDGAELDSTLTAFSNKNIVDGKYVAPAGLAPTDAIARELFTSYASAKQGGAFDVKAASASVQDIVARRIAAEPKDTPLQYTLSDLHVHSDVTLSAYLGSLTAALKPADQVKEYELSVFARAVSNKDPKELDKLKETANLYNGIVDSLLAMNVPQTVAIQHLAAINGMASLAYEVKKLSEWSSDPFDAIVLVGKYGTAEDAMTKSMQTLFAFVSVLKQQT